MQKREVKQKVTAVLFDMDGVLIDSANAWFHVMNDALQHFGYGKISFKRFRKNFGSPIEEDAKILFKEMKIFILK